MYRTMQRVIYLKNDLVKIILFKILHEIEPISDKERFKEIVELLGRV